MELFDVTIVGSGPAGLTAAIYTARANLKTLVLAGTKWGGQLMLTTTVENFPGFPDGIEGPELMEKMRVQASKFGALIKEESVIECHPGARRAIGSSDAKADAIASLQHDNEFVVKTTNSEYRSRAVIIATGAETKWLGLPNEQKLIGHGVSSCAPCDAFFFKNKKVAVVGGGDSACEEALFLTKFASEVVIIHRRDSLRASKIMQDRVKSNQKIKLLFNTEIVDVLGESKVEGLKLKDSRTQNLEPRTLLVDGLFVAVGHKPNDELLAGLAGQEGVFIAGDVIDTKYKQAITAAASGCMAAMDAEKYLDSIGAN